MLEPGASAPDGQRIDLGSRIVLPGLIDCHVHVMAVHHDVWQLSMQPPTYITAQASHILEGMLMRGFTTVHDAAGQTTVCSWQSNVVICAGRGCSSRALHRRRPEGMPISGPVA